MRTPLRYQSQLLPRRSYKPQRGARRALVISFRPSRRFVLPVAKPTWSATATGNAVSLEKAGMAPNLTRSS